MHKTPNFKTKKKLYLYHWFLSAPNTYILLILCFLIFISLIVYKERINNHPGWQYIFQNEIPLQKTLPPELRSFYLHDLSIFIRLSEGYTYSLNRFTGAVNWKHDSQDYSIFNPAFEKPNIVYLNNFDGRLYAIDQASGKELWRFTTPGLIKADTGPILTSNLVLFGSRNGILYALDKNSGTPQWTFQTKPIDRTHYSPNEVIIHFGQLIADDQYVYINSSTDNTIYALNPKNGKEVWRFANYGYVFQMPTIYGQSITFWDVEGTYYILNKQNGNIIYSTKTPQSRVYQGKTKTYIINQDHTVDGIDVSTGIKQWTYDGGDIVPNVLREVNKTRLIAASNEDNRTIITLIDATSGKKLWTKSIPNMQVDSVLEGDGRIYFISVYRQCSLSYGGTDLWCTDKTANVHQAYMSDKGLYIISTYEKFTHITLLHPSDGSQKWKYESDNINGDTVKEYHGDIYFLSKDNRSLSMIDGNFPNHQLRDSDLNTIVDTNADSSWISKLVRFVSSYKNIPIHVYAPDDHTLLNDIYELSINLDETVYPNKYDDADIMGIFTDANGRTYKTKAFYYDKNIWKLRFVPTSIGKWTWKLLVNNKFSVRHHGSFDVLKSDKPGFLSISQKDSRFFTAQNENVFVPLGIQNCTGDYYHDGNQLSLWPLNAEIRPTTDTGSYPTSSMDDYLSTYAKSGFNVFRWGVGNCSFVLWKTVSPDGNRYALNKGVLLDTLFSSLKNHGFHVWMSLFSFSLPYGDSLSQVQKQKLLKKYLDYVVARYAVYVDVWELANEIDLGDTTTAFMSDYIRSIDPYHHPITTNWERPNLPSIEITSLHWYSRECNDLCDKDINAKIKAYQTQNKPIVFSEKGNDYASWDENSAARMRIQLWIGYFRKVFYIFWNTTSVLFLNKQGNSNIYLGPIERQYVSAFSSFASGTYDNLQDYPVTAESKEDKVYAFNNGEQIMGYIYRQIIEAPHKTTVIHIAIPKDGVITWLDPATGALISEQPMVKGVQVFTSPDFSTDIAFKILLSGK